MLKISIVNLSFLGFYLGLRYTTALFLMCTFQYESIYIIITCLISQIVLYKKLLGHKPTLSDLAMVDPMLARSLQQVGWCEFVYWYSNGHIFSFLSLMATLRRHSVAHSKSAQGKVNFIDSATIAHFFFFFLLTAAVGWQESQKSLTWSPRVILYHLPTIIARNTLSSMSIICWSSRFPRYEYCWSHKQ